MQPILQWSLFLLLFSSTLGAVPRQHAVSLGKSNTVKWLVGDDDAKAIDLKIRPLVVDGRVKEFIVGAIHDVTERTFVAQRVYRLNDSLPQETVPNRWRWERGGWLLVDRTTGKVQAIALPGFDPHQSSASWFRDYAAYCGFSDDGKRMFATIFQLGKRKPLLKNPLGDAGNFEMPDAECSAPMWQRSPPRVTFEPHDGRRIEYSVRSRAVDLVFEDEDAGGE